MSESQAANRKPVSILLAEDDREMRRMLNRILTHEGYTVDACNDGMQLLEHLESFSQKPKRRYDLIVSDIRMPGFTGLEILDFVHENGDLPPVLLITAFGDERTHAQAEQSGAAAVLDKPFDIDEFSQTVSTILRENRNRLRERARDEGKSNSPFGVPVDVIFRSVPRYDDLVNRIYEAVLELQNVAPDILHCRVILNGTTHTDMAEQCVARVILTIPGKVFVVDNGHGTNTTQAGLRAGIEELFSILEGRIRKHQEDIGVPTNDVTASKDPAP